MASTHQVVLASDMTFENIMHKRTAQTEAGFSAMLKKDKEAQQLAVDEYFQHWDNKEAKDETEETRASRTKDYAALTRQYYNLATDFYEYGWCQSFHFCRFGAREAFAAAIARHEHYLAHMIGIRPKMRVLDVGCGVGGPAREIAKFTGAYVTGITINEYQVQRATRYAEQDGLAGNCRFVVGDFMKLPFEEESFDAVYAIEATVHAPRLEGVYSEIFKVLKPGGVFGVYEWVMTDRYDHDNLEHRKCRLDIEQGDGIANMVKAEVAIEAMKAAGFELLEVEDLAERFVNGEDLAPWYWPLDGSGWRYANNMWDVMGTFRMTRWGRWLAHNFMATLETLRLAPPGTKKTGDSLSKAAEALVLGGKERLFTPMFLMVGRKPLAAKGEEKLI
ncbi:sterol 24-C-methyltransferase [Coniella lustricola]|uniref:Sterol 24-C-methyltransferase n=1 Tax=Coniella lustricola TaxID=2025994 RepID=A0A2T3A8K8_9PEZI|nr:sterol 24-C-methyltransferase [Coniella lustricola]